MPSYVTDMSLSQNILIILDLCNVSKKISKVKMNVLFHPVVDM